MTTTIPPTATKTTTPIITTVAGTGTAGYSGDNGPATSAQLNGPQGVAVNPAGTLYIADHSNNRVRKVTGAGVITTVAGTGTAGYSGDNGPATSAQLYYPTDVVVDSAGTLYITDSINHRVRKVTGIAGAVTPVTPVTGTVARFVNVLSGLVVEVQGESVSEGTEIHQYTNTGKNHQKWRLTIVDQDNGRDVYTLENVNSGKVVEVVQASTQSGEILVQRTYGGKGARHHQWILIPTGQDPSKKVYKIMNRNSGLVFDIGNNNTPTVIKQYGSWDDDGRQQWQLIPV